MNQNSTLTTAGKMINPSSDLDPAVSNPSTWLSEALTVPREEGVVTVAGCDLHFFRWGDPSKPGLLMLHGFLAHARCFAFIAPFLAADYHVVAYDMSGMGDSQARDSYSNEIRVTELLGVAEHTGLFENNRKPTMVAHSYGGRIGTSAMHAHPDKFAGIVICDLMILRPSVLKENAKKFKALGNQRCDQPNRLYPDYATAKKRFVLAPPQVVEVPELLDFMAYHSLRHVKEGWQWKFDPSVFKRDAGSQQAWARAGEDVVKISGRKVIVYGERSLLFSADSALYVRELVSQTGGVPFPIISIPHAGHHLMLDQPMALISVLKTVLSLWSD